MPLLSALQFAFAVASAADSLPRVVANDNRQPAGTESAGVRRVQLVVRMARWYPEADNGGFATAAAFAEEGRAPRIPGPLVRVRTGTMLDVSIRNALDSTITIHGLFTRPAASRDSVRIPAGETRSVRFLSGAPGTYFYHARVDGVNPDSVENEQLAGALIVDPEGELKPDRVFVINIWGRMVDSVTYRNALTINGRSWPNTERLTNAVNDTVRWRLVNASQREHPMHLHGFYFRVDATGTAMRDSVFDAAGQRLAVTEVMRAGTTMTMTWAPDRPGNWLFHCHLGFHVIPEARLDPPRAGEYHDQLSHDADRHMAGLVLGIAVPEPRGWREPRRNKPRRLRLVMQEVKPRARSPRALGFVLQDGRRPPAADSAHIGNQLLHLRRGEPTDITVVNRMPEAAAVHWHGIELESFSDGVAGWSGKAKKVAPVIAPNDSFVARLTLPRAGTFIYHTHLNDLAQITSGLYGGIIVTEPGAPFDPSRDHVFVVGWDSPADPPHLLINGDSASARPLEFRAGAEHRIRMINIGVAGSVRFTIRRAMPADTSTMSWRLIAKDGADLPAHQITTRPSRQGVNVGETRDAMIALPTPGEYELMVGFGGMKPQYRRRIIVVP